jgi:hypothetical protein
MQTIMKADTGVAEALDKACKEGLDRNHLVYLLELVAEGKITDFFTEELIDKGSNEVDVLVINVPQFDSEYKHCCLSKV